MSYVFKQIDPNDVYVVPFYAHKTFQLSNTTSSGSGVFVYQAEYSRPHVEITGNNPEQTSINEYKFAVHASLDSLYYENYALDPFNKLDYHNSSEKRFLHSKATAFSVPQNIYGEGLKKGTTILNVAGNNVEEDNNGNLIDTARQALSETLKTTMDASRVAEYNFDDGYKYGTTLIDKCYVRNSIQLNLRALCKNVYFKDGAYGSQVEFAGSGSSFVADHQSLFNFQSSDDFLISGFFTFPTDQHYLVDNSNIVFSKGDSGPYPFRLEINNSTHPTDAGQLIFSRYDGMRTTRVSSSIDVNDGIRRHLAFRKSGTDLQIYIDGVLDTTQEDLSSGDTINSHSLFLGTNLTGSIDEFRIFNDPFTQAEVQNFGTYESGSNWQYIVGNVFHKTGMVVLTSPYSEYAGLTDNTGSYTFESRGTRRIEEWELICTMYGAEFNMTTNLSATDDGWNYSGYVTHSIFTPYITQIGLYNDNHELLAIAKPSVPIKKPDNLDLTFIIRFDV